VPQKLLFRPNPQVFDAAAPKVDEREGNLIEPEANLGAGDCNLDDFPSNLGHYDWKEGRPIAKSEA